MKFSGFDWDLSGFKPIWFEIEPKCAALKCGCRAASWTR